LQELITSPCLTDTRSDIGETQKRQFYPFRFR